MGSWGGTGGLAADSARRRGLAGSPRGLRDNEDIVYKSEPELKECWTRFLLVYSKRVRGTEAREGRVYFEIKNDRKTKNFKRRKNTSKEKKLDSVE